jgi:hypothetical protein
VKQLYAQTACKVYLQLHALLPEVFVVVPALQFLQTLLPSIAANVLIGHGVQSTARLLEDEKMKPLLQQTHGLLPSGFLCCVQELQPLPQPTVVKLTLSASG